MKSSEKGLWVEPEQHFKEQKDRYYFLTFVDNTIKEREAYDFRVLTSFVGKTKLLTAFDIILNGKCIQLLSLMIFNIF